MTVPDEVTARDVTARDVTAATLADRVLAPAGSPMVLAEWTAQGGTGETPLYQAPLHAHPEAEAWYVLEGSLCIRIGDDSSEIGPGGAVIVPGGIPHTYWNPGTEPARYVLVMGSQTYALIQAIHAAPDRSPQTMRRLFAQYGATLLEP